MQKWCPEPFTLEGPTVGPSAFQPESPEPKAAVGQDLAVVRFRKESGFSTTEALMSHLTREERATVFDLVEIDVAKEYQGREQELQEQFEEKLTDARNEFQTWAKEFQEQMDKELREISAASVDLALQLAERVVRTRIELDPEVLVRAIENTLFRIQGGKHLTVTVNPEDGQRLQSDPEMMERLHIGTVETDRRIEKGGCLIESGGREWDATLTGQFDALGEIIQELLAAPSDEPLPTDTEPDGAPDVESVE